MPKYAIQKALEILKLALQILHYELINRFYLPVFDIHFETWNAKDYIVAGKVELTSEIVVYAWPLHLY